MLQTVLLLLSICGLVRSSGIAVAPLGLSGPIAALGHPISANAPVVTAASSQFFERTYNRLVVPPAPAPIFPVALAPTVFTEPAAVSPQPPPPPPPQEPVQPNIAIAVATAHAAAPVATILLPPYPFGFPPTFGFFPSEQPNSISDENTKEPTTPKTTQTEIVTTPEPISTTPIDASSSDNNVVQALPSNENVNFNLYGPPPQGSRPQFQQEPGSQTPNGQFQPQMPNLQFQPQQPNTQVQFQRPNPQFQPQRLNPQFQTQWTNPPIQPKKPNVQLSPQNSVQFQLQKPNTQYQQQQPEFPPYPPRQQVQPQNQFQQKPQQQLLPQYRPAQQQPWPQQKGRPQKLKTSVEVVPVPLAYITPPPLHKTHAHVKVVKHIYSFVPASSAKIVRKPVKIRPLRLVKHKIVRLQNLQAEDRDIEITTLNPFRRSNTKPPRV